MDIEERLNQLNSWIAADAERIYILEDRLRQQQQEIFSLYQKIAELEKGCQSQKQKKTYLKK